VPQNDPFETINRAFDKELTAEYIVTDGTNRLDSGGSSDWDGSGGTDYSASREIGHFDAAPNHSYTLSFHVSSSPPALASTHPVVKIVVDHLVFKREWADAAWFTILGLALAVIGSACALSLLIRLLIRFCIAKRRKASSDH
jgi:hypothetical protein